MFRLFLLYLSGMFMVLLLKFIFGLPLGYF